MNKLKVNQRNTFYDNNLYDTLEMLSYKQSHFIFVYRQTDFYLHLLKRNGIYRDKII